MQARAAAADEEVGAGTLNPGLAATVVVRAGRGRAVGWSGTGRSVIAARLTTDQAGAARGPDLWRATTALSGAEGRRIVAHAVTIAVVGAAAGARVGRTAGPSAGIAVGPALVRVADILRLAHARSADQVRGGTAD